MSQFGPFDYPFSAPLGDTPSSPSSILILPAGTDSCQELPHDTPCPQDHLVYSLSYVDGSPFSTDDAFYSSQALMQSLDDADKYASRLTCPESTSDGSGTPSRWMVPELSPPGALPLLHEISHMHPISVEPCAYTQCEFPSPEQLHYPWEGTFDPVAYETDQFFPTPPTPVSCTARDTLCETEHDGVDNVITHTNKANTTPMLKASPTKKSEATFPTIGDHQDAMPSPEALETELEFLQGEWGTVCMMLNSLRNAFRAESPDAAQPWCTMNAVKTTGPSQGLKQQVTPPILSNPAMQREMQTAFDDLMLQVRQLEKKIDKLQGETGKVSEWIKRNGCGILNVPETASPAPVRQKKHPGTRRTLLKRNWDPVHYTNSDGTPRKQHKRLPRRPPKGQDQQ